MSQATTLLGNTVFADESTPAHACTSCGICCFSTLETYVRVTGDDWARLAEKAEQFAHFVGHRAYMKLENGHCAALLVLTAPDGKREYRCQVYDQRPQICRDLQRGSPECAGERTLKSKRVETG